MFLGRPWLHNAHVTHDRGNNLITIKSNGTMRTIAMTKHLDNNTKHHKVLLCYDFTKRITYEEEEMLFVAKLNLFMIGTITLLESEILSFAISSAKVIIKCGCNSLVLVH
jgi:hypothetical protein